MENLSDPDAHQLFTTASTSSLSENLINEPCDYIASLPSKNMVKLLIAALNTWYQVPQDRLEIIMTSVFELQYTSLMFDDIQDGSTLRRGHPAAHTIFGVGQVVNSASLKVLTVLQRMNALGPHATQILLDELRALHIGQGHELYWTYHSAVPSEKDYIAMVDGKTAGFFRLCSRLLRSEATTNMDLEMEDFTTLIGRFYQIRDDYMNLVSTDYANTKGFCSDFDEGKYSLALMHALQFPDSVIKSMLQQGKLTGSLSYEMKCLMLEKLKNAGSLEHSLAVLKALFCTIQEKLKIIEEKTGTRSVMLGKMLDKIEVR